MGAASLPSSALPGLAWSPRAQSAAAAAPPQATSTVSPAVDEVALYWLVDDPFRVLETLLSGLGRCAALGAEPTSGAPRAAFGIVQPLAPSELGDHAEECARLEVALILATEALAGYVSSDFYGSLLLSQFIREPGRQHPRLHPLDARLAWLTREGARLRPVANWGFVGPFDNERGRGMARPTLPEREPAALSYPGKLRKVAWRETPPLGPDGIVRIGALLHPEQQSCVIARSWVRAEEAQDVLMLVGASEELRVWWNGAPVLAALGEHEFAPDAHTLRVRLQAGWNEVALKVGAQDGELAFSLRFVTEPTGAPVALHSTGTPPDGVQAQVLTDPGQGRTATTSVARPGAFAYYRGRTDSEALVALALLQRDARALPRKERPGAATAIAAAAAAPQSIAATLAELLTTRVSGALLVEQDFNPWLTKLRAGLERFGDRPLLLLWYADHAEHGQGLPRRALEFVDRGLAVRPSSLELRRRRVRLLHQLGQGALADLELVQLVDLALAGPTGIDPMTLAFVPGGGRWPDLCDVLARQLPRGSAAVESLAQIAEVAGVRSALRQRELDMRLTQRSRDPREVFAAVNSDLEIEPWDVESRLLASQKLLALGGEDLALVLLDDAVALCPEAPELHSARARALLALGDTAEAQAALERTLELDLSAADEQRLLEYVQSLGATAAKEAPFHARFQEPLADILTRRASDTPLTDSSAPREVLLQRMVVEVAPDGTARRYQRVVERVRNAVGAKELDRRGFRAFPGENEVRVLTADVLHADGSVGRARTGRTGGGGSFTVDLPPLVAGDIVDLEWRHDDLRPSIFGTYFGLDAGFSPDPRLAVRESEVIVLARPGVDLTQHITGLEELASAVRFEERALPDGTVERTWRLAGIEPRRAEALEPPAIEWQPRVQASTYADWNEFGRWWWNLIREELSVSPEMQTKVAELTAGLTTPLEKLRAVYDFIVTDIRYNAWEFGINGYRPYSAPVIFSRRFGDCKDKAILMRAMLGEVGIEAWPVIIRSEGRRFEEDHELALISAFNHCIAYIPEQPGIPEMFLDGTARLHPLEVLPDSDRGAKVLIVRDDGVEPVRIPFTPAAQNLMREVTVVDMTSGDRPKVTLTRTPSGRFDPRERHLFTGTDEARADTVRRLLSSRFGALVGEQRGEHPDYEDLKQSVTVKLESEVERVGRETPGGLELPTTFDPLRLLSSVATETERSTDLLLDVPWSTERELRYELPSGARIRAVPEPLNVENDDVSYSRTVEVEVGTEHTNVIVRERFELRTHRVPVGRYTRFRELVREVDEAQREMIDVEVAR